MPVESESPEVSPIKGSTGEGTPQWPRWSSPLSPPKLDCMDTPVHDSSPQSDLSTFSPPRLERHDGNLWTESPLLQQSTPAKFCVEESSPTDACHEIPGGTHSDTNGSLPLDILRDDNTQIVAASDCASDRVRLWAKPGQTLTRRASAPLRYCTAPEQESHGTPSPPRPQSEQRPFRAHGNGERTLQSMDEVRAEMAQWREDMRAQAASKSGAEKKDITKGTAASPITSPLK